MLPNHTNAPKRQFRFQWGALGVFVVTEFRKATKRSRMHPNSTKHTKTSVLDPMGWIGCIRDRAGVPDLSVSGDKFDLAEVDPHDPTTSSEPEAPMQSLNQLTVVTDLVDARSA